MNKPTPYIFYDFHEVANYVGVDYDEWWDWECDRGLCQNYLAYFNRDHLKEMQEDLEDEDLGIYIREGALKFYEAVLDNFEDEKGEVRLEVSW